MTSIKAFAKKFDSNLNKLAREMGPMYVGLGIGEIVGEGIVKFIVKDNGQYKAFLRKRLGDQIILYSALTLVGAGLVTIRELCNEAKEKSEAETADETCEGSDESFAE